MIEASLWTPRRQRDATSSLMQLHFTGTETTFGYFEATRNYLERYGKPTAFCSEKASVFRPTQTSAVFGQGVTQFGRALFELNIDTWCANTSQAKGRVERANLTLQDRLVKEMRLRGIVSREAANEFAPHFMADYNARFAKPARSGFDAHRPMRADENLNEIFTWRLQRKVSQSLTLQHDRVIYLLSDTLANRKLIHRYIDVWEFPDGRIEIRADGRVVKHERYDRLPVIDAGAVVENKRLGRALEVAQLMQAKRDDRRHCGGPSRTNLGQPVPLRNKKPGTKHLKQFTDAELRSAIEQVCSPLVPKKPPFALKPRRAKALAMAER